MSPLADEIDWSNPIYSDYGGPSSTADNTVTTGTPDASDPIYSDYGGTPDTTSYNSDGTINEGGTAYSGDLNSGSSLFSGADLARLFKDSPLLKTLGAVGIGKLADKLFDVQKGPGGYKGGIPDLVSSRQMLPIPKTMQNAAGQTVARRPGSGGISYFTPNQYLTPAQAAAAKAEQPMIQPAQPPTQSYAPAPFEKDPIPSWMSSPAVQKALTSQAATGNNGEDGGPIFSSASRPELARLAGGGIANLGGYSDGGRLLRGPGDGVSDSIPATIGKDQPARLADGEFVIPARIVSELGNGSTEAGARKLYAMMDRIKKARSKAKNIAADTKSDKHLPA